MQPLPQPMAQGRTAEVYAYGESGILKLYRSGIPVEAIEGEYRIAACVHEAGIATPRPIAIIGREGRTGIVFERIAGESMLQAMLDQPQSADRLAAEMAEIHAAMHTLDAPKIPLQREMLRERIQEAPFLEKTEKEAVLDRLTALPDAAKLCHGDFHPDNVMVSDRAWIIDWMTGMSGHPAGDAARTMLLLKLGTLPSETPEDVVVLINRLRQRLLDVYTERYLKQSGLRMQEIKPWFVPVAAARLTEWLPDEEKRQLVRLIRERLRHE